jgi:hypothetical protein
MSRVIHARLDKETENVRRELARRLHWSDSKLVREGIKALAGRFVAPKRRAIIGQGQFASGVADLGSNKRRLRGFGR